MQLPVLPDVVTSLGNNAGPVLVDIVLGLGQLYFDSLQ